MVRIMPDMQVSPLGGILLWVLVIAIAAGAVLSSGAGGAIVWALMCVVAIAIIYWTLKQTGSRVF
ncbi:hypothetical protein HTZ84_22575 [Haloterrigena sp. SYSU A558-1]|uniref:Uncharacterized protein n=1 Tax=Haloterrigena gelatinilytica TaxID=2741724 RepID=A0ABX2LFM7_9EURY|nr:hypothetical protein [Haloterrigena gelatinilytica]NUC75054.1 hypothetical protein [Haloterrigena gelatinilytica]